VAGFALHTSRALVTRTWDHRAHARCGWEPVTGITGGSPAKLPRGAKRRYRLGTLTQNEPYPTLRALVQQLVELGPDPLGISMANHIAIQYNGWGNTASP